MSMGDAFRPKPTARQLWWGRVLDAATYIGFAVVLGASLGFAQAAGTFLFQWVVS